MSESNYTCRSCHSLADSPMLKDELWEKISHDMPPKSRRNLLCIDCVEKRLGRTITVEDLNNSLWSKVVKQIVDRELARHSVKVQQ